MTTTQQFPTRVLLAVATSRQLQGISFEEALRAVQHLLGEDTAPHQLATPEPWLRAKEELLRQHPSFKESLDALQGAEDPTAWLAKELELLGESMTITQGAGRDPRSVTRDALSSLIALAEKGIV